MKELQRQGGKPVKAWVDGVFLERQAEEQLHDTASLPFIFKHVAVMPDVHFGMGATIGSVVPTKGAIVPACVGVDIGCGMEARKLEGIHANDLPDNLANMRADIESAVPVGRAAHEEPNNWLWNHWRPLRVGYDVLSKTITSGKKSPLQQMGTLGGGNHFVEVCLDENDEVWVMLHSGSRGYGNKIGMHYIALAREECRKWGINLPNRDLAYLPEDTPHFHAYMHGVNWAQEYARQNRKAMMGLVLEAIQQTFDPDVFDTFACGPAGNAVECHHNYIATEHHFGQNVYVTRKGAVRAREGDLGIIPGSMGAKSFIVRGKGNPESFNSCSHGAGRMMSRRAAREKFTVEEHEAATVGVECRKDIGVIDETPGAYKDIDSVMAAQTDLVDIVHTLKAVLCVKG